MLNSVDKQLKDYGFIPSFWWKRLKKEIDEMVESYPYGPLQDICIYIKSELIPNIENSRDTDKY